jgi:hypothetical protein
MGIVAGLLQINARRQGAAVNYYIPGAFDQTIRRARGHTT